MDLGIKGRVAVVTGCSVGIGREVAKTLAEEGVQTVVIARRGDLLATLQDEIEGAGGLRPLAISIDLTDPAAPKRIFEEVSAKFGHADIVVNNAGGSQAVGPDTAEELWEKTYRLNFTVIRQVTDTFLPGMKERKYGRVFTVGGGAEPMGVNATTISKAGTTVWAKALSREVGKFGITVNCIAPGKIHSEQINRRYTSDIKAEWIKQIPAGYFGDPPDIASLITYLCSPRARYINGQRIDVDGGLRRGIF